MCSNTVTQSRGRVSTIECCEIHIAITRSSVHRTVANKVVNELGFWSTSTEWPFETEKHVSVYRPPPISTQLDFLSRLLKAIMNETEL